MLKPAPSKIFVESINKRQPLLLATLSLSWVYICARLSHVLQSIRVCVCVCGLLSRLLCVNAISFGSLSHFVCDYSSTFSLYAELLSYQRFFLFHEKKNFFLYYYFLLIYTFASRSRQFFMTEWRKQKIDASRNWKNRGTLWNIYYIKSGKGKNFLIQQFHLFLLFFG